MDCLTDPRYETVILKWPTQSAKTEILLNFIGHIQDQDPGPILYVIEDLKKAEAIVTDRYLPMLRDTPCLQRFRKVGRGTGKATLDDGIDSHAMLHHSFPGGHLTLVGSNSPTGGSTRPIRYLLLDEWDAYRPSAGTAGDFASLAEKRTLWFHNRKIAKISSPGDDATSRIGPAYEASDQRTYHLPCLKCATFQTLDWEYLRWAKEPTGDLRTGSVGFECRHCTRLIPQRERATMLREGQWKAAYPGRAVAGFWLWGAYCPPVSWSGIVTEYLAKRHDPEQYKVFVNTVKTETWKREGESAQYLDVMIRAEERPQFELPPHVVILTAGVDVQHDRLEVSLYGWGVGEEGWLLGHTVVYGKIGDLETEKELDTVLGGHWTDTNGRTLQLSKVCMDSGYKTDEVYGYARQRTNVLATKGVAKAAAPAVGHPTWQEVDVQGQKIKQGIQLWPLGTHYLKETMMTRLQKSGEGPKTLHYPAGLSEEFYLQLTAEQLETFYRGGERQVRWVKKRPRNDAWDCLNLAYAAAIIVGVRTITTGPTIPSRAVGQGPIETPMPGRGMVPTGTMNRLLGRGTG
jgi:phage terminase large subunit GpA-like protein